MHLNWNFIEAHWNEWMYNNTTFRDHNLVGLLQAMLTGIAYLSRSRSPSITIFVCVLVWNAAVLWNLNDNMTHGSFRIRFHFRPGMLTTVDTMVTLKFYGRLSDQSSNNLVVAIVWDRIDPPKPVQVEILTMTWTDNIWTCLVIWTQSWISDLGRRK